MRRIVVTDMGAVTPLAAEVEASWSRLLAGRSGIQRLPDDVVGDLPAKVGGVISCLDEDPEAGFDPDAEALLAAPLERVSLGDIARQAQPNPLHPQHGAHHHG